MSCKIFEAFSWLFFFQDVVSQTHYRLADKCDLEHFSLTAFKNTSVAKLFVRPMTESSRTLCLSARPVLPAAGLYHMMRELENVSFVRLMPNLDDVQLDMCCCGILLVSC